MNNVTMVIPTEREVNYHIFMYTIYLSPVPSLRQLASFMRTDLGFKQLEVSCFASHGAKAFPRLPATAAAVDGVLGGCEHCMLLVMKQA
jgi:hypothetical protein